MIAVDRKKILKFYRKYNTSVEKSKILQSEEKQTANAFEGGDDRISKKSKNVSGTVRYGTVHYSAVQYSTVQYSTVQYSTVQYSTVQHSTVQ